MCVIKSTSINSENLTSPKTMTWVSERKCKLTQTSLIKRGLNSHFYLTLLDVCNKLVCLWYEYEGMLQENARQKEKRNAVTGAHDKRSQFWLWLRSKGVFLQLKATVIRNELLQLTMERFRVVPGLNPTFPHKEFE